MAVAAHFGILGCCLGGFVNQVLHGVGQEKTDGASVRNMENRSEGMSGAMRQSGHGIAEGHTAHCGGIPITMTGSRMATSGMHSVEPRPSLRLSFVSVSTIAQVASEPVPLVVGIAISLALARKLNSSRTDKDSGSSSGRARSRIIAFAASMQEPPPMPMTQSG